MFRDCGVYRTGSGLANATTGVAALRDRARHLRVDDHGCRYNTDLTDALELGFLLDCAEAMVISASPGPRPAAGTRGRTSPSATTTRWMQHTFATRGGGWRRSP